MACRVFSGMVATITALTLVACSGPASPSPASQGGSQSSAPVDPAWASVLDAGKKEGQILAYAGIFRGTEDQAIAEAFKQATGITFEFVSAASTAPMAQRLRTEIQANQPTADVIEGSSQFIRQLKTEGLFTSVKDKALPALKEDASVWKVNPLAMSPDGDISISRPTSQYDGHIVINSNLLQPADYPKSYAELADPKYKGKLAYVDPKITGDVAARYTRQGYVGGVWALKDIHALYANQAMLLFPGPNDPGTAAARGEIPIGIGANTGTLAQFAKSGGAIKILAFPDAPIVGNPNTMAVVKAAPHPNAALVFMNWFMSKEGQDVINKTQGTSGLRRDVPSYVPDALKAEVVGGGKRGPMMALTDVQSALASDLNGIQVFQRLPDGIPLEEFEGKVNAFIKDWETKQGGPQKEAVVLQE
jgi:ABC-type Fe3+ transport system substrate-binding protein